jgi:hypothetical protein
MFQQNKIYLAVQYPIIRKINNFSEKPFHYFSNTVKKLSLQFILIYNIQALLLF